MATYGGFPHSDVCRGSDQAIHLRPLEASLRSPIPNTEARLGPKKLGSRWAQEWTDEISVASDKGSSK